MDITFHYPPELLTLLVETIPRLCKTKVDLLLFFQGAGVPASILAPHREALRTNKEAFKKFDVSRAVLVKLNELGERGLRERREVLKRVTEFEEFGGCWESDRSAARGLVSQVRQLVNVKDSFTRMKNEKDEERKKRIEEQDTTAAKRKQEKEDRDRVRAAFYAVFAEEDAQKRGKLLEKALNDVFACYGLLVRESFVVKGYCGEGVIEQIDGLVELESQLYLVEMKWWRTPIGVPELAPHLVRVYGRGGVARGLFISYTAFTEPAIAQCRDANTQGSVSILATLDEIVTLLDSDDHLAKWIKAKFQAAIVSRSPYVRVAGSL